jgi:bifunctional DNA-binding transcriptional regulator/antitoxin component of YhaV-PrlF toxin-antitoxin module
MAGRAAALRVPAGVVYGIGRIDASGRVADQAITCALGWREGNRLTLTASPGIVTARRDQGGMVTVPARACIAIPAVLRRRCGLRAGDRVLLAAVPGQHILTELPLTARGTCHAGAVISGPSALYRRGEIRQGWGAVENEASYGKAASSLMDRRRWCRSGQCGSP